MVEQELTTMRLLLDGETARCEACGAKVYTICILGPCYGSEPDYCPACGRKIEAWADDKSL